MQVGYHLGGGLVSFSYGVMDVPFGGVTILRGGSGVVHGITLVGAAGRGNLGWIVGVLDSQNVAVSFDMASSFLLNNFTKGYGSWGFCRSTANSLEILMTLLADDLKGVLEKTGEIFTVSYTRSPCVSIIYTL